MFGISSDKKIQADQELFFNENSLMDKPIVASDIFYKYANKEQFYCFEWLESAKSILEYGCGSGTSLDIFFETRERSDYIIYGVDIAEIAVAKAKKLYPEFSFFKISDNKIPQMQNSSVEGAFMLHVLHHSRNHEDIFREIHAKLQNGGKFFLNDLSSRNPFIRLGRLMFALFSDLFKNKFPEDLVVDGVIPDKYPVDIKLVLKQLENTGFKMLEVGDRPLFFFLFASLNKFVPLARFAPVRFVYEYLIKLENYLVKKTFLKNYSEVFFIKCVKE